MKKFLRILILSLILSAQGAVITFAEEDEAIPVVFSKSGGGQFIYCNNKEFVTEDWLSTAENPEAKYMMNNEDLKPGKYSVFFCFYNWTGFDVEPDIEFKSSSDAVITIDKIGFYTPQGNEEWDCLGAWSDYLGVDIRPMNHTGQYIHYSGETMLPATFNLSNSNEWISKYIYNYEALPPKVTFNMLVDFTIESGEADVNFAALKSYGTLGDRSMHNPNAAFGPYVRDTAVKGVDTQTLPIVEADIEIVIDEDTPNGENLPIKVFNQANPDGVVVDCWTSNINPNKDGSVYCRNTAVSSDMLTLEYKDDSKLGYYGSNVPESERDNIWRMDIYHYDTQQYQSFMPWNASEHVPNAFTSEVRPISEEINPDLEFNLGNFGVTNRHNLTVTNNDSITRTLGYYISSARSSNIVIVRDEDGKILNPYTHTAENAFAISKSMTWDTRTETCMFSAELEPGETKKYILDVILPTNNYGGQINILKADTENQLEYEEESPLPVYDETSVWKDVFFDGEGYMKWEDGSLYTENNGSWEKINLPRATDNLFFEDNYNFEIIKTDSGYAARYCGWDRHSNSISGREEKNKLYILDDAFNLISTVEFADYIHDFVYSDGELYVLSDDIYKAGGDFDFKKANEPMPETNGCYTIAESGGNVYRKDGDGDIIIEFEGDVPAGIVGTKDLFYYKKSSKYYVTSIWMDNILSVSPDGVNWTDIMLPNTFLELLKVYCQDGKIYVDTKYEQLVYDIPSETSVQVRLNDSLLSFETKPEIVSDRTMVPLRFFFEKLGADVGWDDATRKITVEKGDTLIEMQIDSLTAYVDGAESMLDAAPYIKNDRTMIPLRFLSENLGFSVGWDQDTYSAYIDAVL